MSSLNLLVVTPYLVLAGTAVVVMLVSTFSKSHALLLWLTGAGLAGTFASVLVAAASPDRRATALLRIDDYALYFTGLVVVITTAVVFLSYSYLGRTERQRSDYYVLMLLAALGGSILIASTHFASLFLGLEILSVSLYGLISYPRARVQAIEAGLKYLVLAATTAAFLLLGMALIYAVTGFMSLRELAGFAGQATGWDALTYRIGIGLVLAGIGFKLAVVPFHLWTPDVYQGAPAPVAAFVATVSKGAVLVLLLRYIGEVDLAKGGVLAMILSAVAYASMIGGNLLALMQQNVKRLLAYSSIAHMGYMLVALVAGGSSSRIAVAFYLSVYSVSLATAFGVIAVLSRPKDEAESLDVYRGMIRKRPVLASIFTASLLSLAGIPLTAGFLGKFFIVRAGAGSALWGLIAILAITSAMSLYYYLRVIVVVFADEQGVERTRGAGPASRRMGGRLAAVTLSSMTAITIFLGVYPDPLIRLINAVAAAAG
ncbi:MAG: NADH-quinone oxidoreductase subunit N [Actinobacteria bacterium]|nr:NADH-quinone oxidoreductase subunit N [Actinomycetota bacterium]